MCIQLISYPQRHALFRMLEVWNAVNKLNVDLLHRVLNSGYNVDEVGGYFHSSSADSSICHNQKGVCETTDFYPGHSTICDIQHRHCSRKISKKHDATPLQLLIDKALHDSTSDKFYVTYIDILKVLMKHHANTEVVNEDCKTPVMQLVSMRLIEPGSHLQLRVDMVSKLLHFGANVDTIGSSLITPLAIAIYGKWVDIIVLLIRHGADMHAICDMKSSRTPSQCAKFLFYIDHVCRESGMEEDTIRGGTTIEIQRLMDCLVEECIPKIVNVQDASRFKNERTLFTASLVQTLRKMFSYITLRNKRVKMI
jgi:hypothetical protein